MNRLRDAASDMSPRTLYVAHGEERDKFFGFGNDVGRGVEGVAGEDGGEVALQGELDYVVEDEGGLVGGGVLDE